VCGFVGVVREPERGPVRREELEALLPDLAHRGPDGAGVHAGEGFGVAASRLRIQGGAESDQPVVSRDGRFVVAFNGEVLPEAARSLRRSLAERGVRPPGPEAGDTALLAAALAAETRSPAALWAADDVLEALRGGMGALVVFDARERVAFLARDRMGIKPLHVLRTAPGETWFASEILPLLRVAPEARSPVAGGMRDLLRWQYPRGHLPFRGIEALAPGSIRFLRRGSERSIAWGARDGASARDAGSSGAAHVLAGAWQEAAREAAAVDGPVSLLLSGGLDSAATAAWCGRRDVLALTGRFGPAGGRLDESAEAALVARHVGLRHEVVDLEDRDLLLDLPAVVRALEVPLAGPGSLALWRMAARARRHGRVVLTGTGGDELLGGYARVALVMGRAGRWTEGYEPLRARIEAAGTDLGARVRAAFDRTADLAPLLDGDFARFLASAGPEQQAPGDGAGALERMLREEATGTLAALLHVEDRVTMAHGLEGRPVPCLGPVPETAAALPGDWLVGPDGEGKRALREALRGAIPESVRTDPRKRGFPTPFDRAARGAGRDLAESILADRRFAERGWWDVAACRALLAEERPVHDRALFALLSWETWARLFLDGDALARRDAA
jgi:asparagine synthase (glutamine-hydrolysing)